jgi:hypothetical protein
MVGRVEHLARGLSNEFQWHPNKGTEWDKIVAIFALNAVCLVPFQGNAHLELRVDSFSGRYHDSVIRSSQAFWSCFSSECCVFRF